MIQEQTWNRFHISSSSGNLIDYELEAEELVINRNLLFIRNIVKNMILKNDTDDMILIIKYLYVPIVSNFTSLLMILFKLNWKMHVINQLWTTMTLRQSRRIKISLIWNCITAEFPDNLSTSKFWRHCFLIIIQDRISIISIFNHSI